MTRKAAAKNSRLLGEKKARVLVEFVLIIYRVLLFSYLSERERELPHLDHNSSIVNRHPLQRDKQILSRCD